MSQKIVFLTDKTLTREAILDCTKDFKTRYDADVVIVNESMGANNEAMQQYMIRVEHEGPEWIEPNEEYLKEVADADVLVTHFIGVNTRVMDLAKKLKLICILRSGVENVNYTAALERGIAVINAPGRLAAPVADYTVGMIIAESRNIVRSNIIGRQGDWVINFENFPYSQSLGNKVVGLVGLGPIGREVVKRLRAFGARMIAYDPFVKQEDLGDLECTLVSFEELLTTSDFVSVHARLCDETRGLIGAKELAMMKPTAYFINTARAGLVDEAALVNALQDKQIGGAALDVFAEEPLPKDHPLLELRNVTLTPHLAGTISNVAEMSIHAIMPNLDRFFAGQELANLLKKR